MHGISRFVCQKPKRIPLVAARCVPLKRAAHRATVGGVLGCSAFVLAYKHDIVVLGAFKNRAVRNTVLYDGKVNPTPEKVLGHSVAVLVFRRQEQLLRLIFGSRGGRRLPVRRDTCKQFYGFHKAVLSAHLWEQGRAAASSPP